MAKEIKDIQKLIDEKAVRRFNEDYWKAIDPLLQNKLFENVELIYKSVDDEGKEKVIANRMYWVFRENNGVYEAIKKEWLPKYMAEEAEKFVKRVDELRNDVDNLMNVDYSRQEDY